jgi:hypothetical protein
MYSDESLLKTLLEQYRFHLLPIPREDVPVGLVFLYDGRYASEFAKLPQLFDPPFDLPDPSKGDMALFNGKVSHAVEVGFGLKILGGFLALFGAASIVSTIRASYEAKATQFITFSFSPVTRHSVLPYDIKDLLKGRQIKEKDLIYERQGEYFVATGVLLSRSIRIEAKDENKKAANAQVGNDAKAAVEGRVSIEDIGEGLIEYTGNKNLAFGVQLHRLIFNPQDSTFTFPEVTKTVKLMEAGEEARERIVTYIEEPALIGDPAKGDIYLPIT